MYCKQRRSKDGYVSGTGMFKITFPWATHAEEARERLYIKSLPGTSKDETAGNIWVSPETGKLLAALTFFPCFLSFLFFPPGLIRIAQRSGEPLELSTRLHYVALSLAEDYNMTLWVRALLDPAEIQQTTSLPNPQDQPIATPPRFTLPPLKPVTLEAPSLARNRSRRSTSPVKSYAMTPGKRRTRASKEAKEQKEATQQHIRDLELTAAILEEEKEETTTQMSETTPAPAKKRTSRKTSKKTQPVAVSEDSVSNEQVEEHQEVVQDTEPLAELKERVNGSVNETSTESEEKQEKEEEEKKEEIVKDESADKQDIPAQAEETATNDEVESTEQTTEEEPKQEETEVASSSQKENIEPIIFQTPKKVSDPDELPFSLADMETPDKDVPSMLAKAREMLAAVSPAQLAQKFGSPLKNEVKAEDEETEEKESEESTEDATSESTGSKKRKADVVEAEDKETDAATKDSDDSESEAEERPAKRAKVQLAEQIKRERRKHRGAIGLITAIGLV